MVRAMTDENNTPNEEGFDADRINALVEKVHEAMDDLGLYSLNYAVGTSNPDVSEMDNPDIRSLIESGEAQFVLIGTYALNEMCWTERILDPDKFDERKQFLKMMPSESEILAAKLADRFDPNNPLAVFDDDEDDDALDN